MQAALDLVTTLKTSRLAMRHADWLRGEAATPVASAPIKGVVKAVRLCDVGWVGAAGWVEPQPGAPGCHVTPRAPARVTPRE